MRIQVFCAVFSRRAKLAYASSVLVHSSKKRSMQNVGHELAGALVGGLGEESV